MVLLECTGWAGVWHFDKYAYLAVDGVTLATRTTAGESLSVMYRNANVSAISPFLRGAGDFHGIKF